MNKQFDLEELILMKGNSSINAFAVFARIPDNQVYDWCRGKHKPGWKGLMVMCEALDIKEQLVIDALKETHRRNEGSNTKKRKEKSVDSVQQVHTDEGLPKDNGNDGEGNVHIVREDTTVQETPSGPSGSGAV